MGSTRGSNEEKSVGWAIVYNTEFFTSTTLELIGRLLDGGT